MTKPSFVLIHPPVVKPSEPPAGIARLAGVLRAHGVACAVMDVNIEAMHYVLTSEIPAADTWTHRALSHLNRHLDLMRSFEGYRNADRYRRAVADINRILHIAGQGQGRDVQMGLGDYRDAQLSPVRSEALRQAARAPENNPFFEYFHSRLLPRIDGCQANIVGLSVNYLSQAVCAFALIGLIKQRRPDLKVVIGGGLITSWMKLYGPLNFLEKLVDRCVAGPGEVALLKMAGLQPNVQSVLPDYGPFLKHAYFSPGFILPFSASDGCWWRRCVFCPERAEQRPFHPLAHTAVVSQLRQLVDRYRPVMIHLLDNAIAPALLKRLVQFPPGAPWYGFVRIAAPLDDIEFCRRLRAAGCVMLKIGLESGSQHVLDRLEKGVPLHLASRVLNNLHAAGILTYVYLLFGTPAEDETAAHETLDYVVAHAAEIDYLNLSIFNLPLQSPDAQGLPLRCFYEGDLALYHDFKHPAGWHRERVRRFLDKRLKRHPMIQAIIRRDPPVFTSNHAPFWGGDPGGF